MRESTIKDLEGLLKKKQAALSKIEKIEHLKEVASKELDEFYLFQKSINSKYGIDTPKGRVLNVPEELHIEYMSRWNKSLETRELYLKYIDDSGKRLEKKLSLLDEMNALKSLIYWKSKNAI